MRSGTVKQKLLAALLSLSMILTMFGGAIVVKGGGMSVLAATSAPELVAHFDFDGEGNKILLDKSGNGVTAELRQEVSWDTIISEETISEGKTSHVLDLRNSNAYLSMPSSFLKGHKTMTVEMSVLTADAVKNWAFFAAPNDTQQVYQKEHYIGVSLNNNSSGENKIMVERYANSGPRPANTFYDWSVNEWHDIKIVFDENLTTLYIDGEPVASEASNYSLADCIGEDGILWFGRAAWENGQGFNGCIDNIRISDGDEALAEFNFEGTGDERFSDKSQNKTPTTVNNANTIVTDGVNGYLDMTSGPGTSGKNAYLSLSGSSLQGLEEMTVEMRIRTAGGGSNWAFYAAPDDESPVEKYEHYLGVLLNGGLRVERYANDGQRPDDNTLAKVPGWSCNGSNWHTVRVVFAKNSTRLYINGSLYAEAEGGYSLKDCLGSNNSVFYFGHSAWTAHDLYGEGFNGCIDDIKIWDGANDIEEQSVSDDVAKQHEVTDRVVNPTDTVVNMFDYWISDNQTDDDYRPDDITTVQQVMSGGINKDHPFLFIGYDAAKYTYSGTPIEPDRPGGTPIDYIGDKLYVGTWNEGRLTTGIVDKFLSKNDGGYPVLSGNMPITDKLLFPNKDSLPLNESLKYLFDLNDQAGKKAYPNVTGLFQLDDNGYFYFNAHETFAELNVQDGLTAKTDHSNDVGNRITLYDTVWRTIPTSGIAGPSKGQFFPFNDWSDLFHVEEDGSLAQNHDFIYYQNKYGSEKINHYFGMTIETNFTQPLNGMINHGEEDMTFEFSGDDDVWIFIDGVLVGDIGGMHTALSIKINFATGQITGDQSVTGDGEKPVTTLREVFRDALGTDFDENKFIGDTFASGTEHTLKFFYLERGNNISNASIRFNFPDIRPDVLFKSDEKGDALSNVEFELYPAQLTAGASADANTLDKFEIIKTDGVEKPIATVRTDENGYAEFLDADGNIIVFADEEYAYYILKETKTQTGYRIGKDIVLRYDRKNAEGTTGTNTFTVVNKEETGAYASFSAYFAQIKSQVHSAGYDSGGAPTKNDDDIISAADLIEGMTFIVPAMKNADNDIWLPLYGSNDSGWKTVNWSGASTEDYIKALLEAAFNQMSLNGAPDMYMTWDSHTNTLTATISDAPGSATRYLGNNPNGDLSQATLFIPRAVLEKLGLYADGTTYKDGDALFAALQKAVKEYGVETAVSKALAAAKALPGDQTGIKLLYTSDFDRTYRSVLHIINIPLQLTVSKVDEEGNPLSGAVFGLYSSADKAYAGGNDWIISGTTKANGMVTLDLSSLSKLPDQQRFWLREIKAPNGYKPTTNLIEVIVDNTSAFANATAYSYKDKDFITGEDNVRVYAAVGKIAQNVIRFTDNDIVDDLKLAQITGQKNTVGSSEESELKWNSGGFFDPLYFNGRNDKFTYTLLDYAAAENYDPADYTDGDEILESLGIIMAEDGFAYVKPMLNGVDMSSMFSLVNIVEVTNYSDDPIKSEVKPGNGETVKPGQLIDYTISWGNYSNDEATLTITDPLDDNVEFVSAEYNYGDGIVTLKAGDKSVTGGPDDSVTISYSEGKVIWKFRNVPSGKEVEVGLTVRVKDNIKNGDIIENQAKVSNDKIPGDEYTDKVVNPVVDLDISKAQAVNGGTPTTETKPVQAGDEVTYYLYVTVKGTADAELKGIVVQDMVPEGLELIAGSADSDKPGTVINENITHGDTVIIEWALGTGIAGETYVLSYTVKVPSVEETTWWTNIAYVTSGFEDNNHPTYPKDPKNPHPWKPSNEVEIYEEIDSVAYLEISKDQSVNGGDRTTDTLEVKAKDEVTYYLTVTIKGTPDATLDGIVVQDKIPEGLTLVEGSISDNGTVDSNGIIEWRLGTRTVGDEIVLKYTVKVPQVDEETTWANTAYVISDIDDDEDPPEYPTDPEDPDDWTPSETVEIYEKDPEIDLDISKDQSVNGGDRTTDRLEVKAGDKVTYYLTVTLTGTPDANLKGIVVQDKIPEGLELVEGSISDNGTVDSNGIIEWRLGTRTVGDEIVLKYTVKVPQVDEETTWKNTAYVISDIDDEEDPPEYPTDPKDPDDWTPSETVEIYEKDPEIDLDISKDQSVNGGDRTTDTLEVKADDEVTYYLTVTLTGTPDANLKGIVVQDKIPEGLELVEGSISDNGTVDSNGIIEWRLGTRTVGDKIVLNYTVKVPEVDKKTTWKNTAYVISNVDDNDPPPEYPTDPEDPKDWTPSETVEIYIYVAEPVTADIILNVSKTLTGRDWIEGFDSFLFRLTGYDSDTLAAIENGDIIISDSSVTISKAGQDTDISFGDITFNIEGEFTFIVTEAKGNNGSVTYDKTAYVITMKVVDDKDGHLAVDGVTVTELKDADADIDSGSEVTADGNTYTLSFDNGYAPVGSWPPAIIKQVSGRAWREADVFEFVLELIGPDGVDKSAVTMPGSVIINGIADSYDDVAAEFGDVTFTKPGLYTFKISEVLPEGGHNSGGLIFDTGYYIVTVNVTDNGSGTLEFSTVGVTHFYGEDDTEGTAYYDDEYLFTNVYSLIFDDDGIPTGFENMTDPEEPDDVLPTGVPLGGSTFVAAAALLISSAALTVRKCRHGRKSK